MAFTSSLNSIPHQRWGISCSLDLVWSHELPWPIECTRSEDILLRRQASRGCGYRSFESVSLTHFFTLRANNIIEQEQGLWRLVFFVSHLFLPCLSSFPTVTKWVKDHGQDRCGGTSLETLALEVSSWLHRVQGRSGISRTAVFPSPRLLPSDSFFLHGISVFYLSHS